MDLQRLFFNVNVISAGTSTGSWSGTLSGATHYIETVSGTDNLIVDDASFQ